MTNIQANNVNELGYITQTTGTKQHVRSKKLLTVHTSPHWSVLDQDTSPTVRNYQTQNAGDQAWRQKLKNFIKHEHKEKHRRNEKVRRQMAWHGQTENQTLEFTKVYCQMKPDETAKIRIKLERDRNQENSNEKQRTKSSDLPNLHPY